MIHKKTADARLRLVAKLNLTQEQLQHLDFRLSRPEHKFDCGPGSVWDSSGYQPNLFAVVLVASGEPVGVVYRSGLPNQINASWWIDSRYRGKGYGSEMIDRLAELLMEEGATGIGDIVINTFRGEYDLASRQLVSRLKWALSPAQEV